MPIQVENIPEQGRFQAIVEGHRCVADYTLSPGVMHIVHTGVHPLLQGRGIAAQLIATAFEHVRAQGLKIDPVCSYVQTYIHRHPEVRPWVATP
jgi:predicted GNAT family acetyltransferase